MPAIDDLVHGWVSTDCGRGTSDILWSCLATTFLCVWTVIHLPVPYYRGASPLTLRQRVVRSGIGTALLTVIAPEFLALTAVAELVGSWQNMAKVKNLTKTKWTLTQQFFLGMGGVCLKSQSGIHTQIGTAEVIRAVKKSHNDIKQTTNHSDWTLELENITEDQINDLAKSDTLTKLIACGQALWLVTQVVARLCQQQAITLLEVSTCAYVSCAFVSYAAWWKKPQGCNLPITINCSDEEMSEYVSDPLKNKYYHKAKTWAEYIWAGRIVVSSVVDTGDTNDDEFVDPIVIIILLGLCPTIFGAIHVASWHTTLPSDAELWMWRASSIYCVVVGVVVAVISLLLIDDKPTSIEAFLAWAMNFIITVYFIIRIYMIVEVFLSLRALPRSAFDSVHWSSFVPHI